MLFVVLQKGQTKKDSGSADMVPADGESMLNEMRAIRESLQSFIMDKFLSDMRQMTRLSQIKIESNAKVPETPYDFKRIKKEAKQ